MRQFVRTAVCAALLGAGYLGAVVGLPTDAPQAQHAASSSIIPGSKAREMLAARMAGGQTDISVREACGVMGETAIRLRCMAAMAPTAVSQPDHAIASHAFRRLVASFFTLKL